MEELIVLFTDQAELDFFRENNFPGSVELIPEPIDADSYYQKIVTVISDNDIAIENLFNAGLPEKAETLKFLSFKEIQKEWEERGRSDLDKIYSNKMFFAKKIELDREVQLQQKCGYILRQKTTDSFDPSGLPEIIKKYINEISKETDSDPIITTSSVYSMISSMIGKKIFFSGYFQKLYANIWTLTASGSGKFKTTGLNKGAVIAYDKDKEIQREIKNLKRQLKGLKGKEKAEIEYQIIKAEATSPLLPNRATAEGLLDSLANNHAGGMFLSEFGDWLNTMEKAYNAGLKSLFTDFYDVPDQRSTKTKGGGTVTVQRPFITICGVSTLEWIKQNIKLSDVGSGFFARFLIFYPPQKDTIPPALPQYIEKDDTAKNRIKDILNQVQPGAFTLKYDAMLYFKMIHTRLYESTIKHGEKTREILAPYLKRWSPYILKLAMLNQVFIDPCSKQITLKAVHGAVSIVDYAIQSTTYLFENDLGESEHQAKCRKVLEYIASRGGRVERKTLLMSRQLSGGSKDYDYVIDTLSETSQIIINMDTDRKDKWIYSINTVS